MKKLFLLLAITINGAQAQISTTILYPATGTGNVSQPTAAAISFVGTNGSREIVAAPYTPINKAGDTMTGALAMDASTWVQTAYVASGSTPASISQDFRGYALSSNLNYDTGSGTYTYYNASQTALQVVLHEQHGQVEIRSCAAGLTQPFQIIPGQTLCAQYFFAPTGALFNYPLVVPGFSIGSSQVTTGIQGTTGTNLLAVTGTFTAGHVVGIDANGNGVDGGAAGGGTITINGTSCATGGSCTVSTAPTPSFPDVTTKIATTAFVNTALGGAGTTFLLPVTAIAAGTCSGSLGVSYPNTSTTSVFVVTPQVDESTVTGYGAGGLKMISYYGLVGGVPGVYVKVCNPTSSSITPGSLTVNIRALF